MPCSAQEHRVAIGLFYATIATIMEKKCNRQYTRLRARPFSELGTWCACIGVTMAYVCLLLILSNDVEQNPGPDQSTQLPQTQCYHTCMEQMERGLTDIQNCLKANTAFIHYDIGTHLKRLEGMMNFMNHGMNELRTIISDNTNVINSLKAYQDRLLKRLDKAEYESERLEEYEKRLNIKIFGLQESSEDCKDQVVNLFNHFSKDPQWERGHIDRAFRVGKRQGTKGRPLIATFVNFGDKMFVLADKTMRDNLRRDGIRITSDLTNKQQAEVDHFRDLGFQAYYKSGKLCVENNKGEKIDPDSLKNENNIQHDDSQVPVNGQDRQFTQSGHGNLSVDSQPSHQHHTQYHNGPQLNSFNLPANAHGPFKRPEFFFSIPPWLNNVVPQYGAVQNQNTELNNHHRQQGSLYPSLNHPMFAHSPPSIATVCGPSSPYPSSPRVPYYQPTTETDCTHGMFDRTASNMGLIAGAYSHVGGPKSAEHLNGETESSPQTDTVNDVTTNQDGFNDDDAFYRDIDMPTQSQIDAAPSSVSNSATGVDSAAPPGDKSSGAAAASAPASNASKTQQTPAVQDPRDDGSKTSASKGHLKTNEDSISKNNDLGKTVPSVNDHEKSKTDRVTQSRSTTRH